MPSLDSPSSQACTFSQFQEDHYSRICEYLCEVPRLHRKQWEYVYIYRVLEVFGALQANKRGVGFGVGTEPLLGSFAKAGVKVMATDLPFDQGEAKIWHGSGMQHSGSEILNLLRPGTCELDLFISNVDYQEVDMNRIPEALNGYDFCWSSCALEHLGSIHNGLRFIEKSLDALKPGGLAVHTTEMSTDDRMNTLDHDSTVIFRHADFSSLADILSSMGHKVMALDFNFGDSEIDRHIDFPPYSSDMHLKLMLASQPSTSYGIVIEKSTT